MSPNKRKLVGEDVTDETNSFKQQCSSLQVNLSCVSNLTDSGNGSLRQTALNMVTIDTSSKSNRSSRSNKGDRSHHGIPLKDVSIVLEKINNDNETLNKNCEKLKQAILNKTKQMFDIQNELSLKTHSILNDKRSKKQNETIELDQSIGSTPKDKCESKSIKEQKKQTRLKKRRLFNMNNSKQISFEHDSLRSKNRSQNSSIILAGSNKKPGILNRSSNTSRESMKSCEIESHHSGASNTSACESEFTAVPIGCSTMINNEMLDTENETDSDIAKNQSSLNKCTKKDTVSMEITDMRGGFVRCDDQNIEATAGNSGNTLRTSLNVNTSTDALNESNKSKNKDFGNKQKGVIHSILSEKTQGSINTVRTSLQMNTSLNTSTRLGLRKCHDRSRMSISNDLINESKDIENGVTSIVSTKDISLTEKLKNVFIQSKTEDNNSYAENMKSAEICTKENRINDTSNRRQKSADKIHDGQSYIEATPYPTCRSVLLRSQIKQNAAANSLATNKNPENNRNKSIECTNLDNEQEKIVNETIILDNSSFCKMPSSKSQASVIINESMDNSSLENNQNIRTSTRITRKKKCKKKLLPLNENSQLLTFSPLEEERLLPKCPTFTKRHKKGKKQLLKNKFNRRRKLNNMEHTEGESSKQSLLEDDLQIFDDKKKDTKKPRKIISKKILVKKIVNEDIFKKLEENRENVSKTQMEASVSSRTSTNDFQSLKRLSATQLSRRQAQRINIVATGLSNDDKNMVKSVVRTLGRAKIESNVTKRTTHVVTTGVRTINLLHGIIRGCWLVSLEWVLKSLENNAWLNPEKYEMKHFSKAVLENRKDKQLFGKAYVPELFTACGYIYVQKDTTPPCNILKDLIKAAGGFVTENPETAKIVIGAEGLKETWVLDCITTGELQAYSQYRRH